MRVRGRTAGIVKMAHDTITRFLVSRTFRITTVKRAFVAGNLSLY